MVSPLVTFLQHKNLITTTPVCTGTWSGVVAGQKRTPGQRGVPFNAGSLQLRLQLLPTRALAKCEASVSAHDSAASAANKGPQEGTHDSAFVPRGGLGATTLRTLSFRSLQELAYTLEPPGSHIKVTQNLAVGTTDIAQLLDRPGASHPRTPSYIFFPSYITFTTER